MTDRGVIEKVKAIQMVNVCLPTTDGPSLILPRYTQPEEHQQLLLQRRSLVLFREPSPKILQIESDLVPGGASVQ